MHRTSRGGGTPPPLRAQTLSVRPARLTAAGLAFVAVTAALMLLLAASAHAAVWVIPASARAFPTTPAGVRDTIAIDAAGNEYEGVQVVVRGGGDHQVTFSWGAGSDALITANTALHRVYYVHVTRPTTDLHASAGYYPDPLVPRAFDKAISVPGSTTAFYLLTHVPYGTPPGTLRGDAPRAEREPRSSTSR